MKMSAIAAGLVLLVQCASPATSFAGQISDDQKKIYADEQIRLADALKNRGYTELAVKEYQAIAKDFQGEKVSADAWLGLAECYHAMGKNELCIDAYENYLKKFPDLPTTEAVKISYAETLAEIDPAKEDSALAIMKEIAKSGKSGSVRDFALFSIGKFHLKRGRESDAANAFSELSSREIRSSADIHRFLATMELALLLRKSDLKKSIALLDRISTLDCLDCGERCAAIKLTAQILGESGDYAGAAEKYKDLYVKSFGTDESDSAVIGFTESLLANGSSTRVIRESAAFLPSMKSEEKRIRLVSLLAEAFDKENDSERAEEYCRIALSSTAGTPEDCGKCAEILLSIMAKKTDPQLVLAEARKLIASGKISDQSKRRIVGQIASLGDKIGNERLRDTLIDAENSAGTKDEADFYRYRRGLMENERGDYSAALTLFKSVNNPELKPYEELEIAKCLEKLGHEEDAFEHYSKVAEITEPFALAKSAVMGQSVLALKKEQVQQNIKVLNDFISKHPAAKTDPDIIFHLAFSEMKAKRFPEASASFAKCRELAGEGSSNARDAEIYGCWSLLLEDDWKSAEKSARKVAENQQILKDADPDFLFILGKSLRAHGLHALAVSPLSIVSDKRSNPRQMLDECDYELALSLKEIGKPDDALKRLDEIEKSPSPDLDLLSRSRALAGEINLTIGNKTEAVERFERCLSAPKNRNSAARARLGLAKIFSESPEHLETASSYAIQVFISSEDPQTIAEAMLLHMKICIESGKTAEAKKTYSEYKRRFPATIAPDEKSAAILKQLESP